VCVTALAIAATGPRPARHRLLGLAALHLDQAHVGARFSAAFNPGARVPRYVAERARLEHAVIDELPSFESVADDLLAFLGERPVVAQEAGTTWAFVEQELRRSGRVPPTLSLIDVNALADLLLELPGKPTLASVAQHLGIGVVHVGEPEDEARVVAEVAAQLLGRADPVQLRTLSALELGTAAQVPPPLRRGATARDLPDAPGVYRLRDAHDQVLYVGKARRLRQRLHDYVHRPLGVTRRLEGLADAVSAIDTTLCGSDLQALILEDREIRRLNPRYNTQRRLRPPRVWLRRDRRAIRLAGTPGPGDIVLGPFRNQRAAEAARDLARSVFTDDLDGAWQFLVCPEAVRDQALDSVRSLVQLAEGYAARRSLEHLLAAATVYQPALLPAEPAQARYALVRPAPEQDSLEVFVVDRAILVGQARIPPADLPSVLDTPVPVTEPADRHVVLRWLGAQRPPARLIHLADDALEAVFQAVSELLAARDA
jgi:DNA polymerase III epsilon subunit-like protein